MSRRHVQRDRRRTEREMEEAFAALARGERPLALKIARRARAAGGMNPRILLDHAEIARGCGEDDEAETSLREAIARAPTFAAAFAALADLQHARGKWPQAVRLLGRAVELEPGDAGRIAQLAAWREQLPPEPAGMDVAVAEVEPVPAMPVDVEAARSGLLRAGHCVLPAVLAASECSRWRAAFAADDAALDRATRLAGDGENGDGESATARWFLTPVDAEIAALQARLYLAARALADGLRTVLGEPPAFPPTFAGWQRQRGGPGRTAARIVHVPAGASASPERTADRRAFPLRAVIDLGPGMDAAMTLRVLDVRPGRKVRQSVVATRLGDCALLCCRERLQQVGGADGLQLVAWAFGPAAAARWLLDLPFDDE
jgi:hypothetical protein